MRGLESSGMLAIASVVFAGCTGSKGEDTAQVACQGWGCDTGTDTQDTDDTDSQETGDSGRGDTGPAAAPQVWINEFMASNASTLTDEGDAFPDWFELYNPGTSIVELDGWTMSDDLAIPDKHVFDGGLQLEPGGFMVFFADDDEEEGPRHVGFNLDALGESLGLWAPDGQEVHSVSFGAQSTDVSAAQVPDGSEQWVLAGSPTPGASNGSRR